MEAWETNPLDPAYQKRQDLVNRYLQALNKWEDAYNSENYPGAMARFEESMPLLKPFVDMAKAWSPSHTFDATAIKGLGETAFLYAVTNNKGKLGWLRDTLERIPDLVKFVPIVEEAMRSRDDAERILELCSQEGGFLQKDLKNEIVHTQPGYMVSYLSRFGLIRKTKEGRSNRLFREGVRPSWCYWPLPTIQAAGGVP